MATLLYRLGRLAFRHRRSFALLWLAVLALGVLAALNAPAAPEDDFAMPGTESQKAFQLLDERFPGGKADGADARIVLVAPEGRRLTSGADKETVTRIVDRATDSPQVKTVLDPYATRAVSEDGRTAYATVTYAVKSGDLTEATKDALTGAVRAGEAAGLTVEIGGSALEAKPELGGVTEIIGLLAAAVVLVITFRALVAAGLPLLTALVGLGVGICAIVAVGFSSTTTTLALMLGLAVGIDYALFILSRYRSERAAGHSFEESAGRAVGTAGSAVVFAGLTVVIALAGLSVVGVPTLTRMGLAAAGTVVVAVLVALTLLPALVGFFPRAVLPRAHRAQPPVRPRPAPGRTDARSAADSGPGVEADADAGRRSGDPSADPSGDRAAPPVRAPKESAGTRWARFVLRRPVAALLLGVLGLGVLALPVLDLRLGLPGDEAQPTSTTQRRAYDALAEGFGPGFNGPLTVVVDARDARDPQAAVDRAAKDLAATDGVVSVSPAVFDDARDTALLTAVPATGPGTAATEDLVGTIRAETGALERETGATLLVTGTTAVDIDVSQKLTAALVPYLAVVVGLAVLLLTVVFRSLLIPLKAALGFLLSVAAAFGVIVAVFQYGWLGGLIGVEQTGPVMSMMPIFLIGVVFGLAMDYEVFLVTRMREAYVHGESPRDAVVTGFRHSARVVVAAAVIMISVFAGFIGFSESLVKMMGVGLSSAVLFDAFVVRMTLVPAALALFGDRAWWLPRRLDRLLPDLDVEGERLTRRLEHPDAPHGAPAADHDPLRARV